MVRYKERESCVHCSDISHAHFSVVSDTTRIARLLEILDSLQSGVGPTLEQLIAECGVSRRTVFRDLRTLREAGLGITFDEESGRYALESPVGALGSGFSLQEALALLVVCRWLGHRGTGLPFQHPAYRAAIKVTRLVSDSVREYVEEVEDAISIELDPINPLPDSADVYERLVESIRLKRRVRIVYRSLTGDEGEFETTLAPYRLLFRRRSWYAIGHSTQHDAVRTFNIGRIAEVEWDAATYAIPPGFSIDEHFGNAWGMIRRPDETYDVHVRFQPLVADNVAEVRWHRTQRISWNDDGTLDFHATVEGLDEIRWWVLGYGEQAEVLKPRKLREEMRRQARAMLERYGE